VIVVPALTTGRSRCASQRSAIQEASGVFGRDVCHEAEPFRSAGKWRF
jgi:hypothetical protein